MTKSSIRSKAGQNVPLRSLFRFASKLDWVFMSGAAICSIAFGCSIPVLTFLFGNVTDIFSAKELGIISDQVFTQAVNEQVYYLLALAGGTFCLMLVGSCLWTIAGERQTQRFRQEYLKSIIYKDVGWFDVYGKSSGEIVGSIATHSLELEDALTSRLNAILTNLTSFVTGFGLAFYKDWRLTLVLLGVIPTVGIIFHLTSKPLSKLAKKATKSQNQLGSIAQEVLSCIKIVIAFNGQSREENRFEKIAKETQTISERAFLFESFSLSLLDFFIYGTFALGFYFGGYLVSEKMASPGSVLNVFYACFLGAQSLQWSIGQIAGLVRILAVLSEPFRIIDIRGVNSHEKSCAKVNEEVSLSEQLRGEIEFRNVSFAYPGRPDVPVLQNVSFHIPAGKTVAFVGFSGSGKSTICQLLERFYVPSEDSNVLFDGHDIQSLDLQFLRSQISIVSQEPCLFNASVFTNVAYGRGGDTSQVTEEEVIRVCQLVGIHQDIMRLPKGYATILQGEGGSSSSFLSPGQKQRVAIARALMKKDAKLLILDEATSAVDVRSEKQVIQAIQLTNQSTPRTTLIIAHRLSSIRNADVIFVMSHGRIVETGTFDELRSRENGTFNMLMKAQSIADEDDGVNQSAMDLNQVISPTETNATGFEEQPFVGARPNSPMTEPSPKKQRPLRLNTTITIPDNEAKKKLNDFPLSPISGTPSSPFTSPINSLFFSYPNSMHETFQEASVINQEEGKRLEEINWRSIVTLLRQHITDWKLLCLGICGAIGEGFLTPVFSLILANLLISYVQESKTEIINDTIFWSLIMLLVAFGQGVSRFFKTYPFQTIGERMTFKIRAMLFKTMIHQTPEWYDREDNNASILTTRLMSDTTKLRYIVNAIFGTFVVLFFTIFIALLIAFLYGWELTLVGCVSYPLLILSGRAQVFVYTKFEKLIRDAHEKTSVAAGEMMTNLRTVMAFSLEEVLFEKYNVLLQKPLQFAVKRAVYSSPIFALSNALVFIFQATTFKFGAYLISQGTYNFERMLVVWSIIVFCGISSNRLASGLSLFARSVQAAKHVIDMLNLPLDSDDGETLDGVKGDIRFENVKFTYPSGKQSGTLRGVNMDIPNGKKIAIVGQSGCGKSTLLSLIQKLYHQTSGTIYLDGKDLSTLKPSFVRSQIGLVSQNTHLFSMSIADNIGYGKVNATQAEIEAAAKLASIHDFIIQLPDKYNTVVGDKGALLSGGQRQRISIARALLRNPRILLLDEATSMLDTSSEKAVQATLDEVSNKCTTITIAHRLSTIRNADIIFVMHRGKIVERGTHAELMESGARMSGKEREGMVGLYWKLVVTSEGNL